MVRTLQKKIDGQCIALQIRVLKTKPLENVVQGHSNQFKDKHKVKRLVHVILYVILGRYFGMIFKVVLGCMSTDSCVEEVSAHAT